MNKKKLIEEITLRSEVPTQIRPDDIYKAMYFLSEDKAISITFPSAQLAGGKGYK